MTKSVLYDKLVSVAEGQLSHMNPCGIHKNENGKSVCVNSRYGEAMCCDSCEHRGPDGCTVKSLECKLWLCSDAQARNPVLFASLQTLRQTAVVLGIPLSMRISKEQLQSRGSFNEHR